ncbi:MAG: DUF4870 domain-containing protein [Nanoarchaeota archaeon]
MAEKKTKNKPSGKNKIGKDNTLKILTHILGLLTGFLGPLIIFLVTEKKEEKEHAKKALNWQISHLIYLFAGGIIGIALIFVLVGFVLVPVFFIAFTVLDIVFCIMAAVKASRDELWNYPLAIPFLK